MSEKKNRKGYSVPLCARDFNRGPELDMWASLVEQAINEGFLPFGTKADDVDMINVFVKDALL